jgi:hypothetical protein
MKELFDKYSVQVNNYTTVGALTLNPDYNLV